MKPKAGLLYNKIKYRKYVKSSKCKNKNTSNEQSNEPSNDDAENDPMATVADDLARMSVTDELSTMLFFETCLVTRDKEILKIKLQQTIGLRERAIRKMDNLSFFDSFPFYFIEPDLVK